MSGSSGSTSGGSKMPGFVKDAGKNLYGMSKQAVGNYDPQFYGGQTYADQSQYSQNAIQGMGNFSSQPSQDYLGSVMQGNYLGLNPQMQQAVMNPAMQGVNDQFNSMGRYGSAANQQQSQFAGMQALMPYYDAERQRQQQAAQLLPQMQQQDLAMQAKGGIGQEAYAQQPIDEAMQRNDFSNQQPLMQAQAMRDLISPLFGVGNEQMQGTQGWADQVSGLLGGFGALRK